MDSFFNLDRESHKEQQKKVAAQLLNISKWVLATSKHDAEDTLAFISKYFDHLNDFTKNSMFEHILDLTDTRLVDVNQQNDLLNLLGELLKLKKQVKGL